MNNTLSKLIFRFTKIDSEIIVFSSLGYGYNDSPKMISEKIHKLRPSIKIHWLLKDKSKEKIPDYVIAITPGTKEAYYVISRAIALIENGFGHISAFRRKEKFSKLRFNIMKICLKPNQYFFSTWHGTPIKEIGKDDDPLIVDFFVANGTFYLDNQFVSNVLRKSTFNKMEVKLLGSPRNDCLASKKIENVSLIKRQLGILDDTKIVLYAPTFRANKSLSKEENINNSGIKQIECINFMILLDLLSEKFGGRWIFIARFHNVVEQFVNWSYIYKRYGGFVRNGNFLSDMADYLMITDVLITDISSCLFDFSVTNKPAFLFFPDDKLYERGLYFNLEKLPFPIATSFNALLDNINAFDINNYKNKINAMRKRMGYKDEKNTAIVIAKDIIRTVYGDA